MKECLKVGFHTYHYISLALSYPSPAVCPVISVLPASVKSQQSVTKLENKRHYLFGGSLAFVENFFETLIIIYYVLSTFADVICLNLQ